MPAALSAAGWLGSTLANGVATPDTFLDVNAYMATFAIRGLPAGGNGMARTALGLEPHRHQRLYRLVGVGGR
jgi:hypothetical protein